MNTAHQSPIVRDYFERGRSAACPLIDMHGHWGPMGGGYLPAAAEDKMMATLERAGVERIVCSAHNALLADPVAGNAEMACAMARHPRRLSGYWGVNPNYPRHDAARDMQRQQERFVGECGGALQGDLRGRGFVGFKFLPDYHTYPLDGDRYRPALEYAHAHSLPVLIHTWGGSAFNSPRQVEIIARRHPQAVLLMGHSGFGDWDTSIGLARDHAHVYLELTAVYAAHDFGMMPGGSGTPSALMSCNQVGGVIEHMVEHAGSSKILYGTDMPWYSPYYAAGAVLLARIDDQARHDILHRNARRLLGLADGVSPAAPGKP